PAKSTSILEAVLYPGELPRSDAARVVGASERHARRILSALVERGVLTAASARAVASGFSGDTGAALDAGIVPGKTQQGLKQVCLDLLRSLPIPPQIQRQYHLISYSSGKTFSGLTDGRRTPTPGF